MTLASDAMKGFNKAESSINKDEKAMKPSEKKPAPASASAPKKNDEVVVMNEEQKKMAVDLALLKKFIETNHLGFEDKKRKYVKIDAWQYLAYLKGLVPTFLTEECFTDDKKYYCRTTCILKKDGMVEVSRSTMTACEKEDFLKDLDRFAVMGLSETRAFARAVKNVYGFMLTALGFQSTPFEEITKGEK